MNYQRIKVILVSPIAPPIGGMSTWTQIFKERISDNKSIELEIINSAFIGKNAKTMEVASVFDELKRNMKLFKSALECRKSKTDIIHLNSSGDKFGIIRDIIMVKLFGRDKKIVCQYHCDLTKMLTSRFSKLMLKILASSVSGNIVIEENSYKLLSNYTECEIISNFIDFDYVTSHAKYSVKKQIRSASFAGHVKQEKGVDEIIEASFENKNIIFHLYGRIDKKYKDAMYSNVIFHGETSRDEMLNGIRDTDIFIFPSHSEGFSMALLEAMALKMPIIASRVGAVEKLLVGEQSDLIIPVGDANAISRAINKLESQDLRERLGEANYKKSSEYSDNVQINKIIEKYKEVLGNGKI